MIEVVGRSRRHGRLLELTGAGGRIAEVRRGKDAEPDIAVIDAPDGSWRMCQPVVTGTGRDRLRETLVVDSDGHRAALIHSDGSGTRIEAAEGGTFAYEQTGTSRSCSYRLVGDLFVARATYRPATDFRAHVADELWRRPDRTLLIAIAGALTHHRIQRNRFWPDGLLL